MYICKYIAIYKYIYIFIYIYLFVNMYLHICIYHTQVTRSQAPPIPLRSCWTLIRGTNMTMPCHDCVMILVTCLVNVHRPPSS